MHPSAPIRHRLRILPRRLLYWLAVIVTAAATSIVAAEQAESRLQFDEEPAFELNPNAPLTGVLHFVTSLPCAATVVVTNGEQQTAVPVDANPAKIHDIPILGLHPDRKYELRLQVIDSEGISASRAIAVSTPPLPDDFPTLRVVRSLPERMEPGVTLFSLLRWDDDRASKTFGLFVAVDAAGEVVWYHRADSPAAALHVLPDGHFMFIHGARPKYIREIDRLGNTAGEFQAVALGDEPRAEATPVDVDTFHHDFFPLADGRLLALTSEVRQIAQFPVNTDRPRRGMQPANVVGDVVVELAADGRVMNRWPLLDLLDPTRISYDSFDSFWDNRAYEHVVGGTKDWSHTNAIVRDPRDGGIVLSLRHQDAIVKVDPEKREVVWILGTPAGWRGPLARKVLKADGRLEWPFHQHGVKFTPHGTLLLFDNGNRRAIPPSRPLSPTQTFSRAVEYAVDEEARTVKQVWFYGGPAPHPEYFFSPFLCDADWLPQTGNVLITDGAHVTDSRGQPIDSPPGDAQWARILEVTHDNPAEIVWELLIDDRETRPNIGWSVYRAERLTGL